MGDPGWKGPPERTVYTDEYRMGNAACDFDDVDPGAKIIINYDESLAFLICSIKNLREYF